MAPLLFTVVVNVTGSFRHAILSLAVLFAVGLFVLVRTEVDAAAAEARIRPGQVEGDR
jgi:MFS-type transporter involved in bile tolerance (Atg22 family)